MFFSFLQTVLLRNPILYVISRERTRPGSVKSGIVLGIRGSSVDMYVVIKKVGPHETSFPIMVL